MYKGYRNHLFYKNKTNKTVDSLPFITKCNKCSKLNNIIRSPVVSNIQTCSYCGNPFYILKLV